MRAARLCRAALVISFVLGMMAGSAGYARADRNTPEAVIIDDFQGYDAGIFSRWMIRDSSRKAAEAVYRLGSEEGNVFLKADASNSSVQIAKQVKWDIRRHPVISWKWRARRLPPGGNEEFGRSNDSAASLYVIFLRKRVPLLPLDKQPINVIKYVWSTTLPVGKILNKLKEKLGMVIYEGRFLVLQSGGARAGQWITERRNVRDDYRRLFGKNPPGNPVMVAILTDSNATGSVAAADYDDIVIQER